MARVGYWIKRAQTVLHNAMADALGPHDLTVTQFAVLTGLHEAPGLSNAELARRAFVTPQSMHAVLQELERLQFIVRRPHPQHQRVLQAELTEAGRRILKSASNSVNAIEEQMLRELSNPARSRLGRRSVIHRFAGRSLRIFQRSSTPVTEEPLEVRIDGPVVSGAVPCNRRLGAHPREPVTSSGQKRREAAKRIPTLAATRSWDAQLALRPLPVWAKDSRVTVIRPGGGSLVGSGRPRWQDQRRTDWPRPGFQER